jgi:hypothetical protein
MNIDEARRINHGVKQLAVHNGRELGAMERSVVQTTTDDPNDPEDDGSEKWQSQAER